MAEDQIQDPADSSSGQVFPNEDETIAQSFARLSRSAEILAERVAPVERRSKAQTWLTGVAIVAIVGVLLQGLQTHDLVETAGAQARTNATLSTQIRDCIDPTGKCFADSRSRTGEIERRILADQARRAEEQLEVVCDLFDSHGQERPAACGPDKPDQP